MTPSRQVSYGIGFMAILVRKNCVMPIAMDTELVAERDAKVSGYASGLGYMARAYCVMDNRISYVAASPR